MEIKTDPKSMRQASMYAGSTLPDGSHIVGLVHHDSPYRCGAAVLLASGVVVQYNAGAVRSLPPISTFGQDTAPCPKCGKQWVSGHVAGGCRIYWCDDCHREFEGEVVDVAGFTADELTR